MDIKEIYALKYELDLNIQNLINKFSTTTNMTVTDINLEHVYTLASRQPYSTKAHTVIKYEE